MLRIDSRSQTLETPSPLQGTHNPLPTSGSFRIIKFGDPEGYGSWYLGWARNGVDSLSHTTSVSAQ